LDDIAATLMAASGHYLKIRLARWFIYDEVERHNTVLVLKGRMRSYRSKPVLEVEGHRLNVDPHAARLVVRLRRAQRWAEVDGKQVVDARDTRPVMSRAGVAFDPTLPLPVPAIEGTMATWSRSTVWMLSLLQDHVEGDGIGILNYAMAHFEAPASATPLRPDEPRIAEVELRGQHVGASRDACQRIVEGAGLLTVELKLSFVPDGNESFVIPVRLGIDGTCATIETAAGSSVPASVSAKLHRALIDRVRRALDAELDPASLRSLAETIGERARAPEQPQHADIFGPQLAVTATDATGDHDGTGSP
jgi:hypothetical protein